MCFFMQILMEGGKRFENGGECYILFKIRAYCHNEVANYQIL